MLKKFVETNGERIQQFEDALARFIDNIKSVAGVLGMQQTREIAIDLE
jgi:hypothetical protein